MKGINVDQPIRAKNVFFVFLALFWTYIGQPVDHIGWATLMPLSSIYPINPRTNPWNFCEKVLRIGGHWKTMFFWVGHFDFLLLHSYLNQSQINGVAWMGLNFYDYHDFQKIHGIMKHTVCSLINISFSVIYSVTPNSGPSQISIIIDTTTTSTSSRRWLMRIYQYECTSPVRGKTRD